MLVVEYPGQSNKWGVSARFGKIIIRIDLGGNKSSMDAKFKGHFL